MTRQRINETDVHLAVTRVNRLRHELGMPFLTLMLGSAGAYKSTNCLLDGHTNLWSDGRGGFSKRDAWNALRVMELTLAGVIDHQQTMREARARTGL